MAGTLTISTLSDGTNSTSTTNCIQGSAKAWAKFDGSAATVTASYNVSSVTKTSAGQYTITMTNAMSDANYCVFGGCNISGNVTGTVLSIRGSGLTITTSSFMVTATTCANNVQDANLAYVSVFR